VEHGIADDADGTDGHGDDTTAAAGPGPVNTGARNRGVPRVSAGC
jgi:hypothetical protein